MTPSADYDLLLRTVRLARELEKGGFYNAAKLFWAAAFSHEIRATNAMPLAAQPNSLLDEMDAVIAALQAAGSESAVIAAMRSGMRGVQENRTISWEEIPVVAVCRGCGAIRLGDRGACPACGADALTSRQVTPVWFFDPLSPAEVLTTLESGPAALNAFVDGLSEAQLNHPPEPGEWSIRETLWHLLVAEQLFAERVHKLLTEENPLLSGMASWTVTGEGELSAQDILGRLLALRQDTLSRSQEMAAGDWWRTGFHEEWGQVTLLQQATYFARHERSHYAQIAGARQAAGQVS
mgnify:CR=1 FL=1